MFSVTVVEVWRSGAIARCTCNNTTFASLILSLRLRPVINDDQVVHAHIRCLIYCVRVFIQ